MIALLVIILLIDIDHTAMTLGPIYYLRTYLYITCGFICISNMKLLSHPDKSVVSL